MLAQPDTKVKTEIIIISNKKAERPFAQLLQFHVVSLSCVSIIRKWQSPWPKIWIYDLQKRRNDILLFPKKLTQN